MSKSSKYILAGGCSFTDPNFLSIPHPDMDCSWPKWPEVLGEYLNLKVVNIAKSGVGNDYITSQLIQNILKDHANIELVVVGWTEIQRFGILDIYRFNPMTSLYRPESYEQFTEQTKAVIPLFKYLYGKFLIDRTFKDYTNLYTEQVTYWFKQMWQVQELCKVLNIKFIMAPICGSITLAKYHQIENSFDSKIPWTEVEWHIAYGRINELYDLDKNHYIGYPFLKSLHGFLLNDKIKGKEISDLDLHPNAEGHEYIARKYYEQYSKVYS